MNKRQPAGKKTATKVNVSKAGATQGIDKKMVAQSKVVARSLSKSSMPLNSKGAGLLLQSLIEVFPVGISMDPSPGRPVLIFKDKDQKQILPVWLDYLEAGLMLADSSQKTRLSGVHHAVLKIHEEFKLSVDSCVFDEIVGHQQYVTLQMHQEGGAQKTLKLRAAEAMSLCLKARTKFFTTSDVIQKSRDIDMSLMTMAQMAAQGLGVQGVIPDYLKN